MTAKPELVRAFIDLGEAFEMINTRIVRETDLRVDLVPLSRSAILVSLLLLQRTSASEEELLALTGESVRPLRKVLRELEQQGMAASSVANGAVVFHSTAKAIEVHRLARDRLAKAVRYALAHLTRSQTDDLERAVVAVTAISHGLGLRDVDDTGGRNL